MEFVLVILDFQRFKSRKWFEKQGGFWTECNIIRWAVIYMQGWSVALYLWEVNITLSNNQKEKKVTGLKHVLLRVKVKTYKSRSVFFTEFCNYK